MTRIGALAAVLALGAGTTVQASERDWGATLAADARALHTTYRDSHPGAVDPENPGFVEALDRGLAVTLERAKTALSWPDYWWAMREYVAGFNDGHVFINTTADAPSLPVGWPGFLTRSEKDVPVVATREDGADAPPLGARLVSCDGEPADRLTGETVGRFRGLWTLASQRETHGWRLFLDAGNPYARRPETCRFAHEGGEREYRLVWRPLAQPELERRLPAVSAAFRAPVERRTFGDAGLWISAGTFSGDLSFEPGKALEALVGGLEKDPAAIAAARVIVLDVRGNGGGSSRWGDRIAATIWGERNAAAAKPRSAAVDWRVSAANIAEMQAYADDPEGDPEIRAWTRGGVAGMTRAQTAGRALWRQPSSADAAASPAIDPAAFKTRAKVFVLTDSACGSACLDALDVWLKLRAVQVGRETSADSLYMEIRQQVLPSGLSRVSVPMKVYRNRPRGLNQPYRPVHVFGAEMRDPAALEARILALAGN